MNNRKEINFLYPYLKGHNKLHILDIGCGDGSLLSDIYDFIPNKVFKLIGVDDESLEELEFYNDDFTDNHNTVLNRTIMPKGIAEFYKQDGFNFLTTTLIPQDLIIISNVLHFYPWEKQKEIVKMALTKLSLIGILYIKNANEFHKYKEEANKYTLDENKINEIKSFGKILALEKTKNHYSLILKS